MDIRDRIARRLPRLERKAGLSQNKWAAAGGMSSSHLTALKKGTSENPDAPFPSVGTLLGLCKEAKFPLWALLHESDDLFDAVEAERMSEQDAARIATALSIMRFDSLVERLDEVLGLLNRTDSSAQQASATANEPSEPPQEKKPANPRRRSPGSSARQPGEAKRDARPSSSEPQE